MWLEHRALLPQGTMSGIKIALCQSHTGSCSFAFWIRVHSATLDW